MPRSPTPPPGDRVDRPSARRRGRLHDGAGVRKGTSMRWRAAAAAIGLALTGCAASQPAALWPGPDWRAAGLPAASNDTANPEIGAPAARDDTPTRVPRVQ